MGIRNSLLMAAGAVVTVVGVVFALQGFGVIGGSFMSGNSVWAVLGPLVALAGLLIGAVGLRGIRAAS